jgi:hypothetical protein
VSKALLDPRSADRLAKIAGMFGPEHANERAAAAAQAHALVRRLGLSWYDVISGMPEQQPDVTAVGRDWRQMARACEAEAHRFRSHEAKFIREMKMARDLPSKKQLDWLTGLYERIIVDVGQRGGRR